MKTIEKLQLLTLNFAVFTFPCHVKGQSHAANYKKLCYQRRMAQHTV